jgi:Antirestriction protein
LKGDTNVIDRTTETNESVAPTAVRIAERDRLSALPRHFGLQSMLRVESAVYSAMRELAREYTGGYWHYYELENGGFYMAPDAATPFAVSVHGNHFTGTLSADAVGIVASLFGINRVANTGCERCIEHYYLLRDYAASHAENGDIFRAID